MLTTIKGYYDHGKIILTEPSPVKSRANVIVTFLDDGLSGPQKNEIHFGSFDGQITMSDDFNAPLDELKDYM